MINKITLFIFCLFALPLCADNNKTIHVTTPAALVAHLEQHQNDEIVADIDVILNKDNVDEWPLNKLTKAYIKVRTASEACDIATKLPDLLSLKIYIHETKDQSRMSSIDRHPLDELDSLKDKREKMGKKLLTFHNDYPNQKGRSSHDDDDNPEEATSVSTALPDDQNLRLSPYTLYAIRMKALSYNEHLQPYVDRLLKTLNLDVTHFDRDEILTALDVLRTHSYNYEIRWEILRTLIDKPYFSGKAKAYVTYRNKASFSNDENYLKLATILNELPLDAAAWLCTTLTTYFAYSKRGLNSFIGELTQIAKDAENRDKWSAFFEKHQELIVQNPWQTDFFIQTMLTIGLENEELMLKAHAFLEGGFELATILAGVKDAAVLDETLRLAHRLKPMINLVPAAKHYHWHHRGYVEFWLGTFPFLIHLAESPATPAERNVLDKFEGCTASTDTPLDLKIGQIPADRRLPIFQRFDEFIKLAPHSQNSFDIADGFRLLSALYDNPNYIAVLHMINNLFSEGYQDPKNLPPIWTKKREIVAAFCALPLGSHEAALDIVAAELNQSSTEEREATFLSCLHNITPDQIEAQKKLNAWNSSKIGQVANFVEKWMPE